MKKFCFLTLVLLAVALGSSAQVLYVCKSPCGDTITYLLGTHYRIDKKKFFHDPLIDSLVKKSNTVFVEPFINTGDSHYEANKKLLIKEAKFPDGKKLNDYLSTRQMKRVYTFYKREFQVSEKDFSKYTSYTPFFMNRKLQYKPGVSLSLDHLLIEQAKKCDKKLVCLDDIETLLKTYRWINSFYNTDWLLKYVKNYSREKPAMDRDKSMMDYAYLNQDTAGIQLLMQKYNTNIEVVVKQRNLSWEKVIAANSSTCNFLGAGISHILLNEGGLLNYYKDMGYTVRAVPVRLRR